MIFMVARLGYEICTIHCGLEAARREIDRRGLTVPLSAPDRTDLPEFKAEDVDFDSCVGAYDLHSYNCVFDSMRGVTHLARLRSE